MGSLHTMLNDHIGHLAFLSKLVLHILLVSLQFLYPVSIVGKLALQEWSSSSKDVRFGSSVKQVASSNHALEDCMQQFGEIAK